MSELLRKYRLYFFIVFTFVLVGFVVMLIWPKGEAILRLNGVDSRGLDFFFSNITKMGEWIGGLIVGLILLLTKKVKYVLTFIIAIGISSGSAKLLKTQVFPSNNRPAMEYNEELRSVNGIELHHNYSFPSGHTTAAFCMFGILALSMGGVEWQIGLSGLACLVGISRMYLGQHYLMDVIAGAVLGSFVALMVYWSLLSTWKGDFVNKRLFKLK
ncbi:MAG: phosphatase PAP2 family protein [Bacteroidia bacterium]